MVWISHGSFSISIGLGKNSSLPPWIAPKATRLRKFRCLTIAILAPGYIRIAFSRFKKCIFCFGQQCNKTCCVLSAFPSPLARTMQKQSLNRCKISEQSTFSKYSKPFEEMCTMQADGAAAILKGGKKREREREATVPLKPSWS